MILSGVTDDILHRLQVVPAPQHFGGQRVSK